MKTRMLAMLILTLGSFWASTAEGQPLREVFKQVNPSVVVSNPYKQTLSRGLKVNSGSLPAWVQEC